MRKAVQQAAALRRSRKEQHQQQQQYDNGSKSPLPPFESLAAEPIPNINSNNSGTGTAPTMAQHQQQQLLQVPATYPPITIAMIGEGTTRRRATPEEAALTAKNYRLAKELSELRIRHREETKNVNRLTMENMNLASRCREAISHVSILKKELATLQRRAARDGHSLTFEPSTDSKEQQSRVQHTSRSRSRARSRDKQQPQASTHMGRALELSRDLDAMDEFLSQSSSLLTPRNNSNTNNHASGSSPRRLNQTNNNNIKNPSHSGFDEDHDHNNNEDDEEELDVLGGELPPPPVSATRGRSQSRAESASSPPPKDRNNNTNYASSFFPHSASPKLPDRQYQHRDRGANHSYNEEFPSDITQVHRLNARQRIPNLGGNFGLLDEDAAGTENNANNMDAFEASFSQPTSILDSFSTTATTITSSTTDPNGSNNKNRAPGTTPPPKNVSSSTMTTVAYNPFSASPHGSPSSSRSTVAAPPASLSFSFSRETRQQQQQSASMSTTSTMLAPITSATTRQQLQQSQRTVQRDPPGKNRTSHRGTSGTGQHQQEQQQQPPTQSPQQQYAGGISIQAPPSLQSIRTSSTTSNFFADAAPCLAVARNNRPSSTSPSSSASLPSPSSSLSAASPLGGAGGSRTTTSPPLAQSNAGGGRPAIASSGAALGGSNNTNNKSPSTSPHNVQQQEQQQPKSQQEQHYGNDNGGGGGYITPPSAAAAAAAEKAAAEQGTSTNAERNSSNAFYESRLRYEKALEESSRAMEQSSTSSSRSFLFASSSSTTFQNPKPVDGRGTLLHHYRTQSVDSVTGGAFAPMIQRQEQQQSSPRAQQLSMSSRHEPLHRRTSSNGDASPHENWARRLDTCDTPASTLSFDGLTTSLSDGNVPATRVAKGTLFRQDTTSSVSSIDDPPDAFLPTPRPPVESGTVSSASALDGPTAPTTSFSGTKPQQQQLSSSSCLPPISPNRSEEKKVEDAVEVARNRVPDIPAYSGGGDGGASRQRSFTAEDGRFSSRSRQFRGAFSFEDDRLGNKSNNRPYGRAISPRQSENTSTSATTTASSSRAGIGPQSQSNTSTCLFESDEIKSNNKPGDSSPSCAAPTLSSSSSSFDEKKSETSSTGGVGAGILDSPARGAAGSGGIVSVKDRVSLFSSAAATPVSPEAEYARMSRSPATVVIKSPPTFVDAGDIPLVSSLQPGGGAAPPPPSLLSSSSSRSPHLSVSSYFPFSPGAAAALPAPPSIEARTTAEYSLL